MQNPLFSGFIENKGQKSWSECCNRHLYFVSIFVSIFYLNSSFLWFFFSVVTHICTGPNRRRHWTGCFGLIWGSIHRNVLQPLTALMLTNAYFWTVRFPGQGIWKKCHGARKCSELGAESGRTSITSYNCFANENILEWKKRHLNMNSKSI